MTDLFPLICDFTNPYREHDTTMQSLWAQLNNPIQQDAPLRRGVVKSKPPTATGPLSIIADVERQCALTLGMYMKTTIRTGTGRARDVPAELRAIRWHIMRNDPVEADVWVKHLTTWINEAKQVLGLIRQPSVALPRGTRCQHCDEAWVTSRNGEGQVVREPAVVLMWVEPDRTDVDYFACMACGESSEPGLLPSLVDHQLLPLRKDVDA